MVREDARLEARQAGFLAYLLNEAPTPAFVERMRGNMAKWERSDSEMPGDMARYLRDTADQPADEVALALSRDWTRLFRGVSSGEGFCLAPPYEACYTGREGAGASPRLFLELQDIYAGLGLACAANGSRPDYVGTLLAFVSLLWEKELDGECSLEEAQEIALLRERFGREHLQSWVGDFCRQAAPYAQTLFYRGVLEKLAGFADQGGEENRKEARL